MRRIGWRRVAMAVIGGVLGVSAAVLMKAFADIDVAAPSASMPLVGGGDTLRTDGGLAQCASAAGMVRRREVRHLHPLGLLLDSWIRTERQLRARAQNRLRPGDARAPVCRGLLERHQGSLDALRGVPPRPLRRRCRTKASSRCSRRTCADWDPGGRGRRSSTKQARRYVVLVAKYHDGFCLWPTGVPNLHQPDWFSRRDLVGELAAAVRARGLRFGVYYSGGVDWTFRPRISRTLGDYIGFSTPGGDYPAYADAQVRELIARYHPDILWNDISWPTDRDSLFRLFADYYATQPEGVVNDRWSETTLTSLLMRLKPARLAVRRVDEAGVHSRIRTCWSEIARSRCRTGTS